MKKNHFIVNVVMNVLLSMVLIVVAFVGLGGKSVTASVSNKAVYRGNIEQPNVALMFNVYGGAEYVEGILKTLEDYDAKATFFIGGIWASKNNATLKLIAEKGHEIGSHGYFHKDAEKLTYEQNMEEIKMADKLINELVGVTPTLFAPPSGSIGSSMFKACEELDKVVIMWSRDTIDWRDKDASLVLKRATLDIQNGELVLMHPTEHTLKALPQILGFYKTKNLTPTTVSKCIAGSDV
ncbi:MAG: polysaccharide deacetylase family protein [Clostridia bacterium]|nr:polysaccharide deacetylase family protein [Clostridia bacterium]MBO7177928.1 polysaccharide deacetylase family protein [Clostridia bacterium]